MLPLWVAGSAFRLLSVLKVLGCHRWASRLVQLLFKTESAVSSTVTREMF
jgi:hypothetical protein